MYNALVEFLKSKSVVLPLSPQDLSGTYSKLDVKHVYLIVMTGRSGSTWLASALSQVAGLGAPFEYFSETRMPHNWDYGPEPEFSEVFEGIVSRNADDGCFGFKTNSQRLFWLGSLVDLVKTFSPAFTSWIDMRRLNLVKQGISYAVARKSGVWHDFKNSDSSSILTSTQVEITDHMIWQEILAVVLLEQSMDEFCRNNNILPLKIFYEEIFDSKTTLLTRVCDFARPGWQVDISGIKERTGKLDKSGYANLEEKFTERYSGLLNEIYSNRAHISVSEFHRRIDGLIK